MGCTTLSRNGSRTGCCTRLSCISRSTPEFRELFHHLLDPLSALLPKLSADHIPLSVQVVDCLAEDDRTPVMTMIKQWSTISPVFYGGVGKGCFVTCRQRRPLNATCMMLKIKSKLMFPDQTCEGHPPILLLKRTIWFQRPLSIQTLNQKLQFFLYPWIVTDLASFWNFPSAGLVSDSEVHQRRLVDETWLPVATFSSRNTGDGVAPVGCWEWRGVSANSQITHLLAGSVFRVSFHGIV